MNTFVLKLFVITLLFFLPIASAESNQSLDSTQRAAKSLLLKDGSLLEYLVYYPKGFKHDASKAYPVVFALHGGIHSDPSLYKVSGAGLTKRAAEGEKFPFVLVAPFNSARQKFWVESDIMALVEHFRAKPYIDDKRLHITGYSRGAYGAWSVVMQNPGVFASLVAVCGATAEPYHVWIDKELPIWVFHGEQDKAIPFEESAELVERLRNKGQDIKFTVYPELEHEIWDTAYNEPDLISWILSQSRS